MRSDNNYETDTNRPQTTTEYCSELQQWMWRCYLGNASWQSWLALSPLLFSPPWTDAQTPAAPASAAGCGQQVFGWQSWYEPPSLSSPYPLDGAQTDSRPGQQHDGSPPQALLGIECKIPSAVRRVLAEAVDFFILFFVMVTVVLWLMHLSGTKDIAKVFINFTEVKIDENADLRKMMAVALVYRVLMCAYETVWIWGACGATPGKFLLGLRVVSCDTFTMVRPNRVLVVPASNVSLSASVVRALNKNLVTHDFFQHHRPAHDVVAGTIVVQRRGNL